MKQIFIFFFVVGALCAAGLVCGAVIFGIQNIFDVQIIVAVNVWTDRAMGAVTIMIVCLGVCAVIGGILDATASSKVVAEHVKPETKSELVSARCGYCGAPREQHKG